MYYNNKNDNKSECDCSYNNCKAKSSCKPNNCQNNCSLSEFEYLVEQYNEIENMADKHFIKAIGELCNSIRSIEQGISYNDKGNKIGKQIDKWLLDCIDKFDTNLSECECQRLRECLHELISKIEKLENDGLYYAQIALEKLQEARALDEGLQELKEKVAKNCYPKNNCR